MEQIIIAILSCLAGCLIGWEANSCVQKFKEDHKRAKLDQLKEDVKAKTRSDALVGLVNQKVAGFKIKPKQFYCSKCHDHIDSIHDLTVCSVCGTKLDSGLEIILQAEQIIEEHQCKKKLFDSIRKENKE